jgi:hypothetical protein
VTRGELLALARRYVDDQIATLAQHGSHVALTADERERMAHAAASIVAPSWGIRLGRYAPSVGVPR